MSGPSYKLLKTTDEMKKNIQEEVKCHQAFQADLVKLHENMTQTPGQIFKLSNEIEQVMLDEPSEFYKEVSKKMLGVLSESSEAQKHAESDAMMMRKKCENAVRNIEVPTAVIYSQLDKNKKLWSNMESARTAVSKSSTEAQRKEKENELKNATMMFEGNKLEVVQKLRTDYEENRIRDWRLIVGNLTALEMKKSALELQILESLTKYLANTNIEREAELSYQMYFSEN